MIHVMDACALIAFLRDERGAQVVDDLLHDPGGVCVAHAVNLCEVYYDFIRVYDIKSAKNALRDLRRVGLKARRDMSTRFWMGIGELKAQGKISFADCFAIQLARQLDGQVVTSDHHEFDAIAAKRVCRVLFIR